MRTEDQANTDPEEIRRIEEEKRRGDLARKQAREDAEETRRIEQEKQGGGR